MELYLHSCHKPSCCDIRHMDNFTFTFNLMLFCRRVIRCRSRIKWKLIVHSDFNISWVILWSYINWKCRSASRGGTVTMVRRDIGVGDRGYSRYKPLFTFVTQKDRGTTETSVNVATSMPAFKPGEPQMRHRWTNLLGKWARSGERAAKNCFKCKS